MRTLQNTRDRNELLERMLRVGPNSEPRWGKMSAHQMICHVADAFRMAIGERPVLCAPSLVERTAIKWLALYVPLRWPAGFTTLPELDQEQGGTRPDDFAADVAQLERLIDRVTAPTRALDGRIHPVFGAMSDAAWLRWGYLHMDHHLRQFDA